MSVSSSLRKSFLLAAVALCRGLRRLRATGRPPPSRHRTGRQRARNADLPHARPQEFLRRQAHSRRRQRLPQSHLGLRSQPRLAGMAIAKTAVAGVSKMTVAIGQKSNPSQVGQLVFFAMPDGQHIISQDELIPFGAHPFARDAQDPRDRSHRPGARGRPRKTCSSSSSPTSSVRTAKTRSPPSIR